MSNETVCWRDLGTVNLLKLGRKESENFSVIVYNGVCEHRRGYGSVSCCVHHVSLLILSISPCRFHYDPVPLHDRRNPKIAPAARTDLDVRRLESNRIFFCGEMKCRWLSSAISKRSKRRMQVKRQKCIGGCPHFFVPVTTISVYTLYALISFKRKRGEIGVYFEAQKIEQVEEIGLEKSVSSR